MNIHTDLLNSHTGYEVSSYFRSALIEVREKRRKLDPKPSEATFLFDRFRTEIVTDVISDVFVEQLDMDVPVKFGDSRSNRSRVAHFVMNDDD